VVKAYNFLANIVGASHPGFDSQCRRKKTIKRESNAPRKDKKTKKVITVIIFRF